MLPRQVRFLDNTVAYGPGAELRPLRDCNALLMDAIRLRQRLVEDGYLLVRGLHPREEVLAVRRQMLQVLAARGAIDAERSLEEGWVQPGSAKLGYGGIGDAAGFRAVVEHARVMQLFSLLLGGPVLSYDFTWLRAVATGEATGAHLDAVDMGRGTQPLLTCWTPWGDLEPEQGTLALLVGSHQLAGWERVHATYGRMDVDRDHVERWFSSDPRRLATSYGGLWAMTAFEAGDVLIFGLRTLHASTTNATKCWRLSADTRHQRADEAVGER